MRLKGDRMMYMKNTVSTLASIPATDLNFVSTLKEATNQQIEQALGIMRNRDGRDKGRIRACERELRRREKE